MTAELIQIDRREWEKTRDERDQFKEALEEIRDCTEPETFPHERAVEGLKRIHPLPPGF